MVMFFGSSRRAGGAAGGAGGGGGFGIVGDVQRVGRRHFELAAIAALQAAAREGVAAKRSFIVGPYHHAAAIAILGGIGRESGGVVDGCGG